MTIENESETDTTNAKFIRFSSYKTKYLKQRLTTTGHLQNHQYYHYYYLRHFRHHHHHYRQQIQSHLWKVKTWLSTGSNCVYLWFKDIKDEMKHRMRHHRNRGPTYPLPIDSSDSTYYTSFNRDDDLYTSRYEKRRYIDPWDLENYDYVRRQLSLSPDRTSTPSPAGEPTSSDFFYLSNNNPEECPACCAGMDEQTFYNAKYETILDDETTTPYCSYTEFETVGDGSSGSSGSGSSSTERNNSSCGTSSVSSLMLHTPGFGAAALNRRRLVLPKPAPRLEFPAPPPYDYCIPTSTCPSCPCLEANNNPNNYCTLPSSCLECSLPMMPITDSNYQIYSPLSSIYGGIGGRIVGSNGSSSGGGGGRSSLCSYNTYTSRFGLSKKGLLQIDYSCNWNDLDRYIATKGL